MVSVDDDDTRPTDEFFCQHQQRPLIAHLYDVNTTQDISQQNIRMMRRRLKTWRPTKFNLMRYLGLPVMQMPEQWKDRFKDTVIKVQLLTDKTFAKTLATNQTAQNKLTLGHLNTAQLTIQIMATEPNNFLFSNRTQCHTAKELCDCRPVGRVRSFNVFRESH